MGCFLACFGSSKDEKRRKQRRRVQPRDRRNSISKPVQAPCSSVQNLSEKPIGPILEPRVKTEEKLSASPRKKVTFDSNIKTYDPVLPHEEGDTLFESAEGWEKEEGKNLEKIRQSKSFSEDNSVVTSVESCPPNHRYQNSRDSDDEDEVLDYADSDIDHNGDDCDFDYDTDDDGDNDLSNNETDEIKELWGISPIQVYSGEVDENSMLKCQLPEKEVTPIGINRNARDRSTYVHPVLNPVENLSQWKAVKEKGTKPSMKPQKENLTWDQGPQNSFGLELPSFNELSFSFKSEVNQPKKPSQEIAVDASLSNWLGSSETTTPINKTSTIASSTVTPEKSMSSQGSNSPRSQEERPILGALTVEELKQFSASSSPKKSPSRSPGEMPIIGTVGTYWHTGLAKDSGSASSFKGIPNTTSKYREDKRVNWHSTPFEKRLERALNNRGAEA